ncbi:MAG: ribulokinase [Thermaerobacter sp.]|nr:ribulokinase [Thermaerobacter sp.]
MPDKLTLGLDFGTDSVRAVVVDTATGEELADEVCEYPRWAAGRYCAPEKNEFRQHPLDHIEGLEEAVRSALSRLGPAAGGQVVGIGIDTTGSTPCAVDRQGRPLALSEEFRDNPNAMFILWKDHTALREAEEINQVAQNWGGTDFTEYEGGVYSAEWFWAKLLHVLREDPAVREATVSWVEHCDWLPALLTGAAGPGRIRRSRCAAGHKAMWHQAWGGLPSEEFLVRVDPLLRGMRERLYAETWTADQRAGFLQPPWADRLGLRPGIAVAVGALDAHVCAVGGGITPGTMVKIMGTSTCDIMVAPKEVIGRKLIAGISGQVDGSVLPGMIGLEAGQSAFGDVYAWFRELLAWPCKAVLPRSAVVDGDTVAALQREVEERLLPLLSEEAGKIRPEETGLVALDWLNGRRTPYADQRLKGVIAGLTLGTSAPKLFRALVEATAFGSKAIVGQFLHEGVGIERIIALGGIARKNELVMQITADVLDMPLMISATDQACAVGAAMFAAVAAGVHDDVEIAQRVMGRGFSKVYRQNPEASKIYKHVYRQYLALGKKLEKQLRRW